MLLINVPAGTTKIAIIENETFFLKPIDHKIVGPEGFAEPKCFVWLEDEQDWEYSTIDINAVA